MRSRTRTGHLSVRLFAERPWWLDHPRLACTPPFTPPDRLNTAWPGLPPELVARGKMRELTSGLLAVASPAKAARVIWFLSFADWVPATRAD